MESNGMIGEGYQVIFFRQTFLVLESGMPCGQRRQKLPSRMDWRGRFKSCKSDKKNFDSTLFRIAQDFNLTLVKPTQRQAARAIESPGKSFPLSLI